MTRVMMIDIDGRHHETFRHEATFPVTALRARQEREAAEQLPFIRELGATPAGWSCDPGRSAGENAVSTLMRPGDRGIVPSLVDRMLYTSPREQAAIAEALGELGDSGAVEALYEVVFVTGEDAWARAAAAEAMERLGDRRGVDLLPSLEATRRAGRIDPFREE